AELAAAMADGELEALANVVAEIAARRRQRGHHADLDRLGLERPPQAQERERCKAGSLPLHRRPSPHMPAARAAGYRLLWSHRCGNGGPLRAALPDRRPLPADVRSLGRSCESRRPRPAREGTASAACWWLGQRDPISRKMREKTCR